VTQDEQGRFAVALLVASTSVGIVVSTCIVFGWISPIWIFIAPFAVLTPFLVYGVVRIFQRAREEREQGEHQLGAGPPPHSA
jgi:hypothetical protein